MSYRVPKMHSHLSVSMWTLIFGLTSNIKVSTSSWMFASVSNPVSRCVINSESRNGRRCFAPKTDSSAESMFLEFSTIWPIWDRRKFMTRLVSPWRIARASSRSFFSLAKLYKTAIRFQALNIWCWIRRQVLKFIEIVFNVCNNNQNISSPTFVYFERNLTSRLFGHWPWYPSQSLKRKTHYENTWICSW